MQFFSEKNKSFAPGLALASLFLIVGLWINKDFGLVVDESNVMTAGQHNLHTLRMMGKGELNIWSPHDLRGYYFVVDTVRAFVASCVRSLNPDFGYVHAFNMGTLVFATLAIFVLYRLTYFLVEDVFVSSLAALTLAMNPQFVAHSQNNAVDTVSLTMFALAVYFFVCVVQHPTAKNYFLTAAFFGCALTTRPMSILIPLIIGSWICVSRGLRWQRQLLSCVIASLIAIPFAFFTWPFLWTHPVIKLFRAYHHLKNMHFDIHEIYLGQSLRISQLPWHYVSLHFISSIPTIFLVLFLFSFLVFVPRWRNHSWIRAEWLGLLWLGTGLALSIKSQLAYNGWRHFLFMLPGFCLLVAIGGGMMVKVLSKTMAYCFIGFSYGVLLVLLIQYHPVEGAYLNEMTNFFIPDHAEKYISIEYFGQAYVVGGRWINAHAEEEATVMVSIFRYLANYSLKRKAKGGNLEIYKDTSHPCYVMYMTRGTMYGSPLVKYLESSNEVPVYEVRRGKGVLLKIYKNLSNLEKKDTIPTQFFSP